MLSYDERRRLGHIETWLHIDDPNFAEGLRSGEPHPPREYRRRPTVLLLCLGLALLTVTAATRAVLPALPAVACLFVVARIRLRRQLDGPARRRRPQ